MTILVSEIRDQVQIEKDIDSLPDLIMFRWLNRLNFSFYRELYNNQAEKYISTADITAIYEFTVSGPSGTYTVGETVTGSSSAATAVVTAFSGTTLTMDTLSGTFTTSDTMTGGTSAVTSTYVSDTEIFTHPLPSDFYDMLPKGTGLFRLNSNNLVVEEYPQTEFGDQRRGWWWDDTEVVLTPETPLGSTTLKLRYIPTISKITADTDAMVFPIRLDEEAFEIAIRFVIGNIEMRDERGDGIVIRQQQLQQAATSEFRKLLNPVRNTLRVESSNRLLGVTKRTGRRIITSN